MTKLFTFVISGAVSGGIYAIVAAGLVLTYQTSGIFNFAHGAVAFTTALVYYELHSPEGGGWPIVPAAIVSILVFAPLLGLALDRLLLRRLSSAPIYARVMGTIGLLVALPQLALWIIEQGNDIFDWDLPSTDQVAKPAGLGPVPAGVWHVTDDITINSDQMTVFVAAGVTALLLWYVLRKTRIGLTMRATVDRRDLARLRGVDTVRTSAVAWVLTMVLAGLAGVILAPFLELADFSFTSVVLGSIVAVVVARFRSIPVAFAAGLSFGVVQNLIFGYADYSLPLTRLRPLAFLNEISGFLSAIPYLLAFLALVVLGQVGGRAAGTVAESEAPPPDHRVGVSAWRRRLPWLVAAAVLVWYVQFVADDFWASQVSSGLVLSLVFLSFVVVTGLGGMVSLAQATFVTTGGFVAGWLVNKRFDTAVPLLTNDGRPNFLVAAIAAAIVSAFVGLLIAVPVRKLGQLELALATLALAFVGELVVFQVDEIGQGSTGYFIDPPQLGRYDFGDPRTMSMLLLGLVALVSLFINNLQRSASGRAMLAVRSSEVAARTSGISPVRWKLALFAVSAGIAGLGGAMFAAVNSPFSYRSAPALIGLIWLAVTVLFGIRRPGGAIIAGLFFSLFPEFLSTAVGYPDAPWTWIPDSVREALASDHFAPILFGLGAINLAQNPDGVLAIAGQDRLEKRRKREARRAERAAPAGAVADELAPVDSGAALQLQAIRAGYGEVEVLHGVDLAVAPGQAVTLLGANGAGKSTLCAVAAGLLVPTRGRVLLAGDDVTAEPPFRRARRGLLLVPEARGLFPGLTVEENLTILLRTAEERRQAYERFPILGQRRKQVAGLLSGGEQQMLGLAPALARPPTVLIADEPTLGLAPIAAEQVAAALAELRDRGVALLLVEEKAREALALADTVAVMDLGRIVWTGPREQADADRLSETYLGVARL